MKGIPAYSLLVKVARGVFQRCVETTLEYNSTKHGPSFSAPVSHEKNNLLLSIILDSKKKGSLFHGL